MLASDDTIYTLPPLARTTAEHAARVYWQLEPGISVRSRAARYAGDRRASLNSIKSLGIAQARAFADERHQQLDRQFADARVQAGRPLPETELRQAGVR